MKKILDILMLSLVSMLIAIAFLKAIEVPEVYADSSQLVYDSTGYPENPPLWAIRKVADRKGNLVPKEKWEQILKGRYRLVPVAVDAVAQAEKEH